MPTEILSELTDWVEAEGREPLPTYSLLQKIALSEDAADAKKAQRLLRQHYDLLPRKEAEQIEVVDLMEQLAAYDSQTIQQIIKHLAGIQLTEGCNGKCAFCLFGKKEGVSKQYSFDSIKQFFLTYYDAIKDSKMSISHYWDSDPFDYQDGEHGYTAVYDMWRKLFPNKYLYISTVIPKGSIDEFKTFYKYLFTAQEEIPAGSITVRLSIGKHNFLRVQSLISEIETEYRAAGVTEEQLQHFYSRYFVFSKRSDTNVLPLGNQIAQHDDMKDSLSPACRDGTVLAPGAIDAIMMTAATVYEPSGQANVPIKPNAHVQEVPESVHVDGYTLAQTPEVLPMKLSQKNILLPPIRKAGQKEKLVLNDPVENFKLHLGRQILSIDLALRQVLRLDSTLTEDETYERFIDRVSVELADTSTNAQLFIDTVAQYLEENPNEMLEYYVAILELRLTQIAFLSNLYLTISTKEIRFVLYIFELITKDNYRAIPQIFEQLYELVLESKDKYSTPKRKIEIVRSITQLLKVTDEVLPMWLTESFYDR